MIYDKVKSAMGIKCSIFKMWKLGMCVGKQGHIDDRPGSSMTGEIMTWEFMNLFCFFPLLLHCFIFCLVNWNFKWLVWRQWHILLTHVQKLCHLSHLCVDLLFLPLQIKGVIPQFRSHFVLGLRGVIVHVLIVDDVFVGDDNFIRISVTLMRLIGNSLHTIKIN